MTTVQKTSIFDVEGLSIRSASFASGMGRAFGLAFSDAALQPAWAASVRELSGAPRLADGAPQLLAKTLKAISTDRKGAARPFFFLTEGSANAGLGDLSTMGEESLLAEGGRVLGELGGCEAAALVHFASGPILTMLPAGECLGALASMLSAPDGSCKPDGAVRTLPFLFDGLSASAGACVLGPFSGKAARWGARTVILATDLAVSRSVLTELLLDLQLDGLERTPARAMIGDSLLLLATGARSAQQRTPIVSLQEPRAAALSAMWKAAVAEAWQSMEKARGYPAVLEPFSLAVRPLAIEVAGAASREEALGVGRVAAARLRVWAEEDAGWASSAEGLVDLLQCIWCALADDAGIRTLERRPVVVRAGDEVLMTDGMPIGAWLQPQRAAAASSELERWQDAAAKWRAGRVPLTIHLGRGPVSTRFWV